MLCRTFAGSEPDRFATAPHRMSANGSPILAGAVAWIDCDIASVLDAGDHAFVLGAVREMQIEDGGLPLLFYQGGYGRFTPLSLTAADPLGYLVGPLHLADLARTEMEKVALDMSCLCVALARVADEVVIVAAAGTPSPHVPPTLVGTRLPFAPPTGAVFAAWDDAALCDQWLMRATSAERETLAAMLVEIRQHGYMLAPHAAALSSYHGRLFDRARTISANPASDKIDHSAEFEMVSTCASAAPAGACSVPVQRADGSIALVLTVLDLPTSNAGIDVATRMSLAAERVTALIAGGPKNTMKVELS